MYEDRGLHRFRRVKLFRVMPPFCSCMWLGSAFYLLKFLIVWEGEKKSQMNLLLFFNVHCFPRIWNQSQYSDVKSKNFVLKKRARNPYGQKTLIVDTSCVNIHHCKIIACLLFFLQMFSTFSLLQYCYAVITEICAHLNISCFTITPKQTKEESSTKEGKAS
jgi:hypothetical protein